MDNVTPPTPLHLLQLILDEGVPIPSLYRVYTTKFPHSQRHLTSGKKNYVFLFLLHHLVYATILYHDKHILEFHSFPFRGRWEWITRKQYEYHLSVMLNDVKR